MPVTPALPFNAAVIHRRRPFRRARKMGNRSDSSAAEALAAAAALPDDVPPLIDGRFEVLEELSRTDRSSKWRGIDKSSGQPVIIRMLAVDSMPAGALMRLEHEALLRLALHSEHKACLLFAGRVGRHHVLVREFVPGMSLAERLAAGPLDYGDTLAVAAGVVSALRDQHGIGVLHRGVRPSNVIVNETGPLTVVRLVNSGTVSQVPGSGTLSPVELEIAAYLSPEQSGLLEQDVAEPSDIYAAGILMYHCVSGHPPFQSPTLGSLLFDHMTAPVPSLRDLQVDVPRAFEELVHRTLRKDPRDRYQSAEAVLADIRALQRAWERNEEPSIVVGSHDHRCSLTEPAFVSRTSEMDQLDRLRSQAAQGVPNVVSLEGESGAGKSRLLEETARRAAGAGFRVYRGRGTNDVAREPFQMLRGIVEGVVSDVRRHPSHGEFLIEHLGEDASVVSTALPGLAPVLGWGGKSAHGSESFGEARTIRALARLLDVLGTEQRPTLVILDDCQWADEQTHRLIRRWQNGIETGTRKSYVQLIVAFRSEEVGEAHILRQKQATAHVRLSSLTDEEVRRLATSMAGPLPDAAMQTVVRLAGGSPFMASAVLRGLVESGALMGSDGGWTVDLLVMSKVHSSSQAGSLLSQRLDLLPPETLQFLSWGAVLGSEFDIDCVARLSGQQPDHVIAAVDEARRRHLIWCRQDGAECVFIHDKIRQALLERQSPSEKQKRHRQAALDLQRNAPDEISALSFHFDAAGMHREALAYALKAAEQASAQHALEIAEQQYLIARRGSAEANRESQFRIEQGLGDVLMVRGRYAEAGQAFERAAQVADGVVAKAALQGKLAELAMKRGDMEQAVSDYSSALRLLGTTVPRTESVLFLMLVWEGIVQGLHTALPSCFVHRKRKSPGEVDRLKMRLLSGLSHGCWYCRSKISVYWSHLRGMNLAERFPPTLELAQLYADHAPAMTIIPIPAFRRGIRYAEKSLAIRKECDDLWGQGQSLHYYGVVLYAASRYKECIDRCRASIRILERLGDYWQVHIARYQIAAAYYRLGDLSSSLAEARLNHKSGLDLGDEQASGIILDVWAWATDGAVPPDILRRERARERTDAQGAAQVLCAQGVCQLGEGDAAGAVDSIEQAIRICDSAGVRNDYTRPLLTWRATAIRKWAEQVRDLTPQTRQSLLQRGTHAAQRALAETRFYRNERPHALRELGLIYAMQGRTRKGLKLLGRSLSLAQRLDARFEQALSQSARARLCKELRFPAAEEQLYHAEVLIAEMQPVSEGDTSSRSAGDLPSLSLIDRFGTVLDAGRKIASALSTNVIFDETQAAASQLLRGETCTLVNVIPSADRLEFTPIDQNFERPVSESILAESVRCGCAVTGGMDKDDPETAAGQETGERSVLGAPILVRGRVVACLYVSHDNVSGLFGPTEERLADFITTIAGAALENAEGFEELQRLNATLERRVADRTRVVEARARELAASNEKLEQTAKRLRVAQAELLASKQQVEVASEAKSRFLAAMSHEVRTPMNGIMGMAELALRTSLSEQQRGYVNTINESAAILLALLNDVLDYSKIEAGKMELEDVPLSLHELVGSSVRMLAGRAAEKKIELICRVSPNVPATMSGDPSRLRQVLINLLGNAIKFTESGEVLVHVWEDKTDDREPANGEAGDGDAAGGETADRRNTKSIHFLVQDTGVGIPAEQQQAIFEAFNQASTSVTRQFGGTGLGLSISTELVSLMQGRLWVESEPGVGSQFHVVVPLGTVEDDQPPPAPPDEPVRPVLLLSEHAAAAAAYQEMLAENGLEVTTVIDAEHAQLAWLEAKRTQQPYLMMVADARADLGIDPTMLHQLRSMIGDDHCPLLLLTPVDQMESSDRFREWGADHVIMKPVIPKDLKRCLNDTGMANANPPEASSANGDPPMISQPFPTSAESNTSLRVLVTDDSAVNREVAGGLLEFLGHQAEFARDGREAVEAVAQSDFDVVLMDIEMPVMDGYEATRTIRQAEAMTGHHVPIIAMSAHAIDELKKAGRDAGMDHYVSKPIEPAQIKYVLENLNEFVTEAVS